MIIRHKRCAFTLTEMAIVIGLGGAFIGGIWVAYGQFIQAKQVEKASEEIRYIVNKIQSLSAINPNAFSVKIDPGCSFTYTICPVVASCVAPNPWPIGFTGSCNPSNNFPIPCGTGDGVCTAAPCTSGISPPASSQSQPIVTYLSTAGIFPSEMVSAGGTSSPWSVGDVQVTLSESTNDCTLGGNAAIVAAARAAVAASPPASTTTYPVSGLNDTGNTYTSGNFTLTYGSPSPTVPIAACVRLINAYGTEWLNMGLNYIRVGNFGAGPPLVASDFSLSNIVGWCTGPGTKTVSISLNFPQQISH